MQDSESRIQRPCQRGLRGRCVKRRTVRTRLLLRSVFCLLPFLSACHSRNNDPNAGLKATHVPYKGSAPAITDLIAGHVSYALETTAAVLPHVKAGKLKALAVTSPRRSISLPDVPTLAEAVGMTGFDVRAWIGFIAPAGIPREARTRLAAEVQKAVDAPEIKSRLIAAGLEPSDLTAEQFAEFLRMQSERFGAVIKAANIKVE